MYEIELKNSELYKWQGEIESKIRSMNEDIADAETERSRLQVRINILSKSIDRIGPESLQLTNILDNYLDQVKMIFNKKEIEIQRLKGELNVFSDSMKYILDVIQEEIIDDED
jgi:chromosome segregation ATPase